MNLRTELTLFKSPWQLDLKDPLLTLGSCFAATLGKRLADNKFQTLINPFGTTYHPFAIDRLLTYAVQQEFPPRDSYVRLNDNWYCHDLHSSFAGESPEQLESIIRLAINEAHSFLRTTKYLILTYGTAQLYERKGDSRFVANCHKQPAGHFSRRIVLPEEIVASFRETTRLLHSLNPALRIILTVSPVRHMKDTLQLNSVSKATLRLACHTIREMDPSTEYFPSFELMMDDLRDYRFYQNDLIHPSSLAEDYIWKKFCDSYVNAETLRFLEEWESIRHSLAHQAFRPQSQEHQAFVTRLLQTLERIHQQVDVSEEMASLKAQLVPQPVSP